MLIILCLQPSESRCYDFSSTFLLTLKNFLHHLPLMPCDYMPELTSVVRFLKTHYLQGEVVGLTHNPHPEGPGATFCLAFTFLLCLVSMAVQVIKACKPPHLVKVVARGLGKPIPGTGCGAP
jgi:hypothetical protein